MLPSSPKFTNFVTISDKNNWDSLYFHKKVHKKTLELHKVTQNPPSHWLNVVPSLKKPRKVVKTRNEQPICNQHWMRGEGVRVSQFLPLTVDCCFYCFYWTYIFTEGATKSSVLKKCFLGICSQFKSKFFFIFKKADKTSAAWLKTYYFTSIF